MRKKIIFILICLLVFSTIAEALSSPNTSTKSPDKDNANVDYSHTILGEFFTMTTCVPCKYSHSALKALYVGGYHPFYYITYVYNKNNHAKERKDELDIVGSPTVAWDGGYRKDYGGSNNETEMTKYNTSIIKCGNRNVKDIDLSLNVEWLGAVNPDPEDDATFVNTGKVLSWTTSEMEIDAEVTNNEASQYNGHLHIYVTEINSTLWDDKWGDPYTFEFKNYAFNEDVTLTAGATWDDSISWDGKDHNDGHGHNFGNIAQDNTMVIAAVFNEYNNDYTDETTGLLAGVNTDPKTFDVYFGDSTPPPQVSSNQSASFYTAGYQLEWNTTYYWKVDVWNNQGNAIYGPIWSFTTRDNNPPHTPSNPNPEDGETDVDVDADLSWTCWDPDGDTVVYDVYFEANDPNPDELVSENQKDSTYDPGIMDYITTYYWKIVAQDRFELEKTGPIWSFTTQENLPPYPPSDPNPPNGTTNVYINANLSWICGDPNPSDNVTYDIYFEEGNHNPSYNGTVGPFPANQTEISYDPSGTMEKFKKYYWKIVALDNQGLSTPGPIWNFDTGINNPPYASTIDGSTNGAAGKEYDYNFSAVDPDGDNVSYYIEWGDGNSTRWTEYVLSGTVITLNHTWDEQGTYNITAKAKDVYEQVGPEGTLTVIMPKNKSFNFNLLSWFLERFPLLEKLLSLIRVI